MTTSMDPWSQRVAHSGCTGPLSVARRAPPLATRATDRMRAAPAESCTRRRYLVPSLHHQVREGGSAQEKPTTGPARQVGLPGSAAGSFGSSRRPLLDEIHVV